MNNLNDEFVSQENNTQKKEKLKDKLKKNKKEILLGSMAIGLIGALCVYTSKNLEEFKNKTLTSDKPIVEEKQEMMDLDISITEEYAGYMRRVLNYIHEDRFSAIDRFILKDDYHKYYLQEFKYFYELENNKISIPLSIIEMYKLDYELNKRKIGYSDETVALNPLLPKSLENEYKVRFRNLYNSSKVILNIIKYTDDKEDILKLMRIINNEEWQEYSEHFILAEIRNYPGILNIKGVQNVLESYMYKKHYGQFKYSNLETMVDFIKEQKMYLEEKSFNPAFTTNPSWDIFFADLYSVYLRGWGIPLLMHYSKGLAIDKKSFEYLREYLAYSYEDIDKLKQKIGRKNLENVKNNWKVLDMLWADQRKYKEDLALNLVALLNNEVEKHLNQAIEKLIDFESPFYKFIKAEYGEEGVMNYLMQAIQTINRILTKTSYGYNYEKNIFYKNRLSDNINALQDTGLFFNGESFIKEKYLPVLNKILEKYPDLSKKYLFFGIEEFPGDLIKDYYEIVAKNKNGEEWNMLRREIENHYFYNPKRIHK